MDRDDVHAIVVMLKSDDSHLPDDKTTSGGRFHGEFEGPRIVYTVEWCMRWSEVERRHSWASLHKSAKGKVAGDMCIRCVANNTLRFGAKTTETSSLGKDEGKVLVLTWVYLVARLGTEDRLPRAAFGDAISDRKSSNFLMRADEARARSSRARTSKIRKGG